MVYTEDFDVLGREKFRPSSYKPASGQGKLKAARSALAADLHLHRPAPSSTQRRFQNPITTFSHHVIQSAIRPPESMAQDNEDAVEDARQDPVNPRDELASLKSKVASLQKQLDNHFEQAREKLEAASEKYRLSLIDRGGMLRRRGIDEGSRLRRRGMGSPSVRQAMRRIRRSSG